MKNPSTNQKYCKKWILLTFLYLPAITLFAQPNDHCADAIELTISSNCSVKVFSNENATVEEKSIAADPSCGHFSGRDIWFYFEVPASGYLRLETQNQSGSVAHSMTLYSGACGDFQEELCISLDRQRTIYRPDLAGQTLYLRMFNYAKTNPEGSPFDLCVYEPEVPVNDLCSNATEIEIENICQLRSYSNAFATAEETTVAALPSCGQYFGGDVWFKAVIPDTENLRIEVPRSVALYSGSCGSFQAIFCNQIDKEEIFPVEPWIGEEIYIRVFTYGSEEGSDFNMCLFNPETPTNDDCAAAIEIAGSETCNKFVYTNQYATPENTSVAPLPSCGQYQGGDVWFKTTISQSGILRIEVPRSVSIYTGTCGNLSEKYCHQLDKQKTYYDDSWIGEEVYIRVFTYGSEEGSEFEICVYSPDLPPNDDCSQAIDLPVSGECNPSKYSNNKATSETSIASIPSCGQYKGGDVWFKSTVPASGNLTIKANLSTTNNQQSVTMYSGKCGSFTELVCSELTDEATLSDSALAGEEIYIRVYRYGTDEGTDFEICAYESNCKNGSHDAGTISICEGDQYRFGSQTLTLPGTYSELFESKNGCDSIVNIQLEFQIEDCPDNEITSLGEDTSEKDKINIYPNPFNESCQIQMDEEYETLKIAIVNTVGQKVYSRQFTNQSFVNLDMNEISNGLYFLSIDTNKHLFVRKILKR